MNIVKIDEEKYILDNKQVNIKTNNNKLILECYNDDLIVLDNYIKELDIILSDNCYVNLYINNKLDSINSTINIYVNNNTSFNLYSGFKTKDNSNIKIINNIKGNNNNSNIKLRGIAKDNLLNIDVSLKVIEKTKDNILVEDIKGITDGGKIMIKPIMEIDTHEVIANHFVTIGNIDKNMLFYLTSKGISKRKAKSLILNGFLNTVKLEVNKNE